MGSLRVGHDWATSLSLFTFMHWRRKWQPTPVFLPGDSQGRGSLVGCLLWGHTKSDMTEATSQQHSKCFIFVKSVHLISVIMVLPKLGHLQKDIQSKSTWKEKMSCVPVFWRNLVTLSMLPGRTQSQGSTFRRDVLHLQEVLADGDAD